jgi:DNA processing protein
MNQEELTYLLALKLTPGIGPVIAQNLIAYCGSPSKIYQLPSGKLMRIPEVGPKTAQGIKNPEALKIAEKEIKWCEKEGIQIIPYTSPDYPALLKQIPDLPLLLFVKGHTPMNAIPWVAVVGTRTPDEYGRESARQISESLTQSGAGILSGLAFGIDMEAHRACLKQGGITAAVLGHGLDKIYPHQHRSLSDKIMEGGGVLISEYISGTKPDAVNFPTRNRIVAGMCRAILVIQAAKTGGALITAKLAFDYDREIFALPGDIHRKASEGCNLLIKDQYARLFLQTQDILDLLRIQENKGMPAQMTSKLQEEGILLSVEEKRLVQLIDSGVQILDELLNAGEWSIARLQGIILAMEVKGIVKMLPGRKVVLSRKIPL